MKQAYQFAGGIPAATGRGSAWKLLGPGGGGAQFVPTISPHNSDRMLVACDMTGAYITQDCGNTWAQFNLRGRVHCFAFDPVEPDTIYAGGSGLFRATDGGAHWQLIFPNSDGLEERMAGDHADHSFLSRDNWPGGEIQFIRVDGYDPTRIYLGIHEEKGLSIYCSQDSGCIWHELCRPAGRQIHSIHLGYFITADKQGLFCFTDREVCFITAGKESFLSRLELPDGISSIASAACGFNPKTGLVEFYIIALHSKEAGKDALTGIWKSNDSGRSWHLLDTRLNEHDSVYGFPTPELTILAVSENDCRIVYAGVAKSLEFGADTGAGSRHEYFGVIKSEDGGQSWKWILKSDYETDPANLQTGWAERDYGLPWHMTGPKGVGPIGLGMCPTNPDICCMTDLSSSMLTTDGGLNWKQVYSADQPDGTASSRGLEVTTCYGVHFDPFDKERMAISYTDIGMFHSRDGGHSWIHGIGGVPVPWGNTCYWIVYDPEVRGRSWSVWGGAHDLPRPKMLRSGGFHRYEGGVCRSDDAMASWQLSNKGMPGNSVVTHIVLDPSSAPGSRTLYAAAFDRGVYKSTDDGVSWALRSNGILGNRNAWRLTMLPDGTLYLLVARGLRGREVVEGALYVSTDAAEHWEKVPLPLGVNAPNDLVFDPVDPRTMYLSCWPVETGDCSLYGGLYETRDGGISWRSVFDQSAHVYASAVHPCDSSVLFTVTFDSSAWYSEDKGNTWVQIDGYDFKWGHRPVVDPVDGNMLYITTFGSGVWHGPWKRI